MAAQSLSERLALLRIVHRKSKIEGKRDWFDAEGNHLGAFDAAEGWEELHRREASDAQVAA